MLFSPSALDARKSEQDHRQIESNASASHGGEITQSDSRDWRVGASDPANAHPAPQPDQDQQQRNALEYGLLGDRQAQGLMAIAAIVGLAIGFATIGLLVYNAQLQRKATEHALSAADAGWEASRIARAQSSAAVHVTIVEHAAGTGSNVFGPDHSAATVRFRVTNFGKTSAFIKHAQRWFQSDEAGHAADNQRDRNMFVNGSVLGEDGFVEATAEAQFLNADERNRVLAGDEFLTFHVKVIYEDIWGDEYTEYFKARYLIPHRRFMGERTMTVKRRETSAKQT